jgi:hypothetical protein
MRHKLLYFGMSSQGDIKFEGTLVLHQAKSEWKFSLDVTAPRMDASCDQSA